MTETGTSEDLAEFDSFLEKNTQLMNGGLFLEYLFLLRLPSRVFVFCAPISSHIKQILHKRFDVEHT